MAVYTIVTVYFSKIEKNSYYQKLVPHPMSGCVDELSSLAKINSAKDALTTIN